MRIAYTMTTGRGGVDRLLHPLAARLRAAGLRVCGTLQVITECESGGCDMDVMVLPDGPEIRISSSRGPGARGCRLDPDALESAVALVARSLEAGADLLLVNKFGRHEAEGCGFRSVIADALARGIPVLVGVNPLNEPAFREFTGDLATKLPCDWDSIAAWASYRKEPSTVY